MADVDLPPVVAAANRYIGAGFRLVVLRPDEKMPVSEKGLAERLA